MHTPTTVVEVCAAHASVSPADARGLVDPRTHFDVILRENQAKNRIHAWVLENFARLRRTDRQGQPGAVELVDGVEYHWTFTGNGASRSLTVELAGAELTGAEKGQLGAFVAQLGIPVNVA